jgi:hypothetical protein
MARRLEASNKRRAFQHDQGVLQLVESLFEELTCLSCLLVAQGGQRSIRMTLVFRVLNWQVVFALTVSHHKKLSGLHFKQ